MRSHLFLVLSVALCGGPRFASAQQSAFSPAVELPGTSFAPTESGAAASITLDVNCSAILDRPGGIKRISVANGEIAEAVAMSPTEIVINGKSAGETSLIVWDQTGKRASLRVRVLPNTGRLDFVREQLLKEVGPDVVLTAQEGLFFLSGLVKDMLLADRAFDIASSLGKVVNLLRVLTPGEDPQILLKVRFADIDRSVATQFGINLVADDPTKGLGASGTGQYGSQPVFTPGTPVVISDLLNIFYFRPDINLGVVIQDLASKNLLQMLAEPNLLTLSGKAASFLAGGEFPFPTLQGGGAGVGQVTIQFRDFGIKLNFTPTVTPRGTIRLKVNPEVSSLDYANGLSVSGFTVPGLTTRRVDTEIELANGQSFVIAGLLNNQVTEQLSRMPGFSSIPLLGKLFQSRNLAKSNTELLILVTPEIVHPLAVGSKPPEVKMAKPFLEGTAKVAPQEPAAENAGKEASSWKRESMGVEEIKRSKLVDSADSAAVSGRGAGTSPITAVPPSTGAPSAAAAPAAGSTSSEQPHPNN